MDDASVAGSAPCVQDPDGGWARPGSNRRPLACMARALPLSYAPRAPRVSGPVQGTAPSAPRTGPPSGGQLGHRVLPAGLLPGVAGTVDLGERDPALRVEQERAADGHAGLVVEHAVGLREIGRASCRERV